MTRNELSIKFTNLKNKFRNLYENSDLDITDIEFDKLYNWLENNEYVLKSEPVDFSERALMVFDTVYEDAKKQIYSKWLR